jgi:ABC-type nitrate/sulfonate/bicarbonate transport system permease component
MAVVLIALISVALFASVQLLARVVMPWRQSTTGTNGS